MKKETERQNSFAHRLAGKGAGSTRNHGARYCRPQGPPGTKRG